MSNLKLALVLGMFPCCSLIAADSGYDFSGLRNPALSSHLEAVSSRSLGARDSGGDPSAPLDASAAATASSAAAAPAPGVHAAYLSRHPSCVAFDGYLLSGEYYTAFSLLDEKRISAFASNLEQSAAELSAHIPARVPQFVEELIQSRQFMRARALVGAYKIHNSRVLENLSFKRQLESSLVSVLGEMARESIFMRDDSRRDKAMEGASLFAEFEFATDLREVVSAQYAEAQETLKAIIDIELAERERMKEEAETPLARAARLAQAERDQIFSEAMKRAIPPTAHPRGED